MSFIYKTLLISIFALSFSGCGDNDYDGKTGLIGSGGSSESVVSNVENIYKSAILKDAKSSYEQSLTLLEAIKELNATTDAVNLQTARNEFIELTLAYKRVESGYVAGYNSDDMRDVADFFIEQFIKGSKSQDISGDLDLVFAGKKSIVINALKGITALEYTLFGNVETLKDITLIMNQNRLDAALLMANNLKKQFKAIEDYYTNDSQFLSSSDDAINALLNVLVDNSFRLRESRIGDAAGFTAKYKDDPDNTRLEYYKSSHSLAAIKEILKTHKSLMSSGLKEIATEGNSASEAEAILTAIDETLSICNSYTTTLEKSLSSPKTQELYNAVKVLQNNYTALINGLNFTQDIVEADGD